MDVIAAKETLRVRSQSSRRALDTRVRSDAAERAAEQFIRHIAVEPPCIVSGYWPMKDELDPRPLLSRLLELGCQCALPVVVGRDQPLLFREWAPHDTLEAGPFGTREPASDAPEVTPGMLIVPLLAFDLRGFRLGYGGGFYDRTLRGLREDHEGCLAIGYAYADQQVDSVPVTDTDERLDWVVTEAYAEAFT